MSFLVNLESKVIKMLCHEEPGKYNLTTTSKLMNPVFTSDYFNLPASLSSVGIILVVAFSILAWHSHEESFRNIRRWK